ncbi:MAG: SNF2-related protein [Candidatus Binataceae bacterium]|jgi:SNF2 family DNA or RNA helicase
MEEKKNAWLLAEPLEGVRLFAETDGIRLRSDELDAANSKNLRARGARSRLGRLLPSLLPQLFELELAEAHSRAVKIPYVDFIALSSHGIDAFDEIVPWAPFALEIGSTGTLGRADFGYFYRHYSGTQIVHLERIGCFVRRRDTVYRLDNQTFQLIEAIDDFNSLPAQKKAGVGAFIEFAKVKGLGEGVGARLDTFLSKERVLVPNRVGLDLIVEEGNRITFAPKVDGVSDDTMRAAFLASDDVDEIYALDDGHGGRIRVVLEESQRECLRRMQRIRHLGGAERAEVLRDPDAVFDGVGNAIDIDLQTFGPRVKGIGDFPFVARPYVQRSETGVFEDRETDGSAPSRSKLSAGLKFEYVDGTVQSIKLSLDEVLALQRKVQEARRSGQGTVEFRGKSIVADHGFARAVDQQVRYLKGSPVPPEGAKEAPPRHYVLIYTNEQTLDYKAGVSKAQLDKIKEQVGKVPHALKRSTLKPHQLQGLEWLQHNFLLGRHGCLLADEMGLGKTLQVLAFLAWLIERGDAGDKPKFSETAPWDPILIVAPLMLVDSGGPWLSDMSNYFEDAGSIFSPYVCLHGDELQKLRKPGGRGRETEIGEPVLDLEKLRQWRVILTNYETVTNYQHSFALMKEHWSVVVTDEAHEYKTPNTKISHALKSLAPLFRIACTGTPVETRLRDVWNILDALEPGELGSEKEFTEKYEKPLLEPATATGFPPIPLLKKTLLFGAPDAFLLRREKAELGDELPRKHAPHEIICDLSPQQREWDRDLRSSADSDGENRHPLALLDQLVKVYQHPALLTGYESPSPREAIEQCPKLDQILKLLHTIEAKREKVLIFARLTYVQDLLKKVIDAEFGLDVGIVSGATPRHPTKRGIQTRSAAVEQFKAHPGFNAIILSPDVAGIGLTLVEANHVIHYGRWWNPAKEDQATDRAYRIGQTREVHVYYLIARDPKGEFRSLDEIMHDLIQRRRALAAEFLAPMPTEDDLKSELASELFEQQPRPGAIKPLSQDDVRVLLPDRFEALVAITEKKQGADVILTPFARDEGIDVIALRHKEIRLIQCKHTRWGGSIDADAVDELLDAVDGYRAWRLRRVSSSYALQAVLSTNGTLTKRARQLADERGVLFVEGSGLQRTLLDTPCSAGEVEVMEQRRLASMPDVQAAINRFLQG